jgi:hypothetical protein
MHLGHEFKFIQLAWNNVKLRGTNTQELFLPVKRLFIVRFEVPNLVI